MAKLNDVITMQQVEESIAYIKSIVNDPEEAHVREDELWERVLRAIANGSPDSVMLATLALTTQSINFPRWCA